MCAWRKRAVCLETTDICVVDDEGDEDEYNSEEYVDNDDDNEDYDSLSYP